MKSDILKFFRVQRQIFGVCPHSGEIFRLSDCKIFLKTRPKQDWKDLLDGEVVRLEEAEERLKERKSRLQERAREIGRRITARAVRKIDPVFTKRRLNPDDAKVIFHPVDFIVFRGMKDSDSIKEILLLDRKRGTNDRKRLQQSLEKTIEREAYEWITLRVKEDGKIEEG